ncbi:succinylglutamate-semialdehyde dehydrogenase [Sphingomonas sp. ID0503]|uniref:succinylglutamate-semialdehyde dehydrogenase n=1 Tax=Sphingomonas sp. ID0503 TaxID=3399691 RepID=UPI003AFA565B
MADIISIDPCTGETVWRAPAGDVDAAVAAIAESWPIWAARPLSVRIETMRRYANAIRKRAEELATLICRETGKPRWDARAEVNLVINKIEASISAYTERTSQRRLEGELGQRVAVRHKPHGVLAVLGACNLPAHLPNSHIVPALIAGNGIVFKPSEKAPATGQLLVECLIEAGVPASAIMFLPGGPEEGRALARHPLIDGVLFTGRTRNGIEMHRQFADTPHKILALEMSSNNAAVVWDTPDLFTAATMVVQSAFLTSGQRCTAVRRVIVRDGAHEAILGEIARLTDRLIVGAPDDDPVPFMGPVIDNDAADAVQAQFLDLVLRGGRPIRHLGRPDPDRPFLTPAIIDVTDATERPDEEIFGPVLQVVRVADFAGAVAEVNRSRYGLGATLIGGGPELYDRFWATTRAGLINWNRPTSGAPLNAPFGGQGLSGNQRASASYAADFCAYPVVSVEAENARAMIGVGLREAA